MNTAHRKPYRRMVCLFLFAAWLTACAAPADQQTATAVRKTLSTPSKTLLSGTQAAQASLTPAATFDPKSLLSTETPLPAPISPYPDGCIDSSLVNLKQAGQTLCVAGYVFNATKTHGDMYIAFSSNQSAFYLVGYDWSSPEGFNQGDCIYTKGQVYSVGSVPMMRVERGDIHICTPPPYSTPTPPATLPTGCRFALDIRLTDYSKLMCVGGVVAYVNAREDMREIYFSLVLTQGVHFIVRGIAKGDRELRPGDCIFSASRRIDKTGQVLVMLLTPPDIQRCRSAAASS
jgi:hypothetical protein